MGEQIQQLTQENGQLKTAVESKQAEAALKAGELQLDERELALKEQQAQATFALKARDADRNDAGMQIKGTQAAQQARSADVDDQQSQAIAELQQQVGALTQFISQLFQQQPAADAGPGTDAPAVPY